MSLSPRGIEKADLLDLVRSLRSRVEGKPTQYHKVAVIRDIAENMLGEIGRLWRRGWITRDEVDYIENEFFRMLKQLWEEKIITKRVYSEITNLYTK